jgi:nitrogenase iron protein NifH
VQELAEDIHSSVIGSLDRSEIVLEAEELGKTVVEAFPDSPMAQQYRELANAMLQACEVTV